MLRYLISMAVLIVGIILAVILPGGGGSIFQFIDLTSFITVVIVPFIITVILFGFGNVKTAFSCLSNKETGKEKLQSAYFFFKSYGRIIWAVGIVMAIIGVIQMMLNLENAEQIGPNMALALISLLYSAILNIILVIPCTIFIKQKM